ncbi:glycoside hydrolase family 99-like domain-containing protein [Halorussus gelatinilyticus]|uniref:Glycoside hydrolase family 99-like domain-containing protein n=1 Tax=Halorussus gelatinilyticus TaxID=2937524 RepID=A0A8U0ILX7_9EURY|nr:glycoside hydrolase family 99-like domain-containing protein [Halorussus gelatinilyticus]UPW01686.1 glycoside hydrolase family 99-like domain-containing protein [Halorussus gelatinilyticus]
MVDESGSSRRRFLAVAMGSSVFAGCGGSSSSTNGRDATTDETATTTEQTTTPDSDPVVENELTFELDAMVGDGESQLEVTGDGSHSGGIDSVRVVFGTGEEVEVTPNGQFETGFEVRRPVPGGQRYGVEVSLVPSNGKPISKRKLSDYVTELQAEDAGNPTVIANYYPWYGPDRHQLFVDEPVISDYNSRNIETIERHVEWATEYGIDAFCTSWWGRESWEDETLSDYFVPAEATNDIEFCLLYETKSLLEHTEDGVVDFDDEQVTEKFVEDVAYVAEEYFGEDNYLRVDGKPLVYVYWAWGFEGGYEAAFTAAEEAAGEELFIVLETVDWRFPTQQDRDLMQAADGVTAYEMYRSIEDINENFAERMTSYYPEWLLAAKDNDCAFLPMVMPGFNNRQTKGGDEDTPIVERSRERTQRVCEKTDQYHDPAVDISFVTSWNEWHEHTQVEPSEEHGTSDLEIIRNTLADGEPEYWITETVSITFSFGETVKESSLTDSIGDVDRDLAFALERIAFEDSYGSQIESYSLGTEGEEPYLSGGVYARATTENKSWRWLGGEDAAATFTFDSSVLQAETLTLEGFPATDGLSGTASVGGLKLGTVEFSERRTQTYSFELI